jgi:GT2 family glycosyltransferase/tetratricopeptide (TPR) repeat protein
MLRFSRASGQPGPIDLGDRARDARQWDAAVQHYRSALAQNPHNPPIWVQFGHALKEAGNRVAAETAYRRAIAGDPTVADTYLQLGHVLKLQGRTQEAKAAYAQALSTDRSLHDAAVELAALGCSAADLPQLMREIPAPAAVDDGSAAGPRQKRRRESVITRGDLARDLGQWDIAAKYYRIALERNPRNPRIWVQFGHALKEGGNPAESEAAYRQALRYDPRVADFHLQLGHTLKLQGKTEAAQAAYLRAFALDPELRDPIPELQGLGWSDQQRAELIGFGFSDLKEAQRGSAAAYEAPIDSDLFDGKEQRNPAEHAYHDWCQLYDTLTDDDRSKIAAHQDRLEYRPIISIIISVCDESSAIVRRAVEAVRGQLYRSWELFLVVGRATDPTAYALVETFRGGDSRIKVFGASDSDDSAATWNSALANASGEFVVFFGADGELSEAALYMIVEELNRHAATDIIYCDEDRIDTNDRRIEPCFKPDWNPDLFYSYNYLGTFTACRTALVREVRGLRAGFEGAEFYDLLLRLVERLDGGRIRHLPFALCHKQGARLPVTRAPAASHDAANAERRALSEHFLRIGQPEVTVVAAADNALHRIIRPLPSPPPLVSLIIPTGGNLDLLRPCIAGLLYETDYESLELIILYNTSTRSEAFPYFDEISADPRVTIVDSQGSFNFSRVCNLGVARARGELVGLLNDDTQVIGSDWLREMVSHAIRPEVGAVGAMLYYGNDTIQHAGLTVGIHGVAEHRFRYAPRGASGYFHSLEVAQDLSGVTAACVLLRRDVYREVGGFEEELAVCFNDVDFCLKIRRKGYLIVWTPFAELYHLERMTAPRDEMPTEQPRFRSEREYIQRKWGARHLENDPYYSLNLGLDNSDSVISGPPRTVRPWTTAL